MSTAPPPVLRALTAWLGVWPEHGLVRVAPSVRRVLAGWDGRVHPLAGVAAVPDGGAVALSVPPSRFAAVSALVEELAARGALQDRRELRERLPAALGRPGSRCLEGVLRWSLAPPSLPRLGRWEASTEPTLPPWLRAFAPTVLVARDDTGRYLGGVGVKRHHRLAREIAVGTEPAARGRGVARALVAQAAQALLDDGGVPLYLHDPSNAASARVAEAAGFADHGWRFLALFDQ